jgi:hypothetical protein
MTRWLVLLAEAWGKVGQPKEGLRVLAQVLTIVDNKGEREYEAELYRIKGELLLQQFHVSRSRSHVGKSPMSKVQSLKSENPNTQDLTPSTHAEAEACFLKAIAIAQHQQAKSLELRAVMSLVRLRQQHTLQEESRNTFHATYAKLGEAHRMLVEVYDWFTEGFDTKDLQEAKALIQELSAHSILQ